LQAQPDAVLDYGSLIWVTLQRVKTAREAINMFDTLTKTYGYASEGESFSIGDKEEVWIMELIGKGEYEKGAVWVARKLVIIIIYICIYYFFDIFILFLYLESLMVM
jgi:dipeptidase